MEADSETFVCSDCGVESPIEEAASFETQQIEDYLVGQVLGDCRIVAKVGEGGFGTVYKAVDQTLQRPVAVKVMLQSLSSNLEFVQKFIREAVTAAQLNHRNIVAIHKVDRDERRGLHYLVMEFVEGETLSDVVEREGVLDVDKLLPIAMQACDALATAHEANIVHRDIKPDNLMIDGSGTVKITDFGLAKSLASDAKTTKVMGTPHYMSPEQFEGTAVDGRSDVYSLGVTFYFLLSKERPYEGENTVQIIYSILTQDPKELTDLAPDVPKPLWTVIQRMIAKKPEDRYGSLRDTMQDLRRLQRKAAPDRSQCSECGAKNPKKRKFCRGCGAELLVKCPSCGSAEPAGTKVCGECGADLARLVKVRKALQAGKRFKALADLRRAEESFREALDHDESNTEAHAELNVISQTIGEVERFKSEADELLHTGELQSALQHIEELLRRHPKAIEVREHRDRLRKQVAAHRVNSLVEQAEAAVTDGDVRRALERLDGALRVDPERSDVRARRDELAQQVAQVTESRQKAVEALAAGRYEDAFSMASEVLKLAPGDTAMEEVQRKARDSVESVDSVVKQGRDLLDERRWGDALSKFEAALALRPGDAQLTELVETTRRHITEHRERLSLCRRLVADGRHAEAQAELETLLAKHPDDAQASSLLESCRSAAEDAERVAAIARAVEGADNLEQTGDLTAAIEQLQQVLDLAPRHEEARSRLRELERRRQRESDLRELADEHLRDGSYEDAVEALERLREANPNRGHEIDREIVEARDREKRVAGGLQRAERALKSREFRRAAEASDVVLDVAPRHPRATAIRKDAEKALAAIDRFLSEADRLILSEMFDEAMEAVDKARERGASREEYEHRRASCEQGRLALIKTDATRSLVARDYEAAIAAYEQVLEVSGRDSDALRGKRSAERRLRILTTEPLALRLGTAAVVLLLLGLVQMTAVASTRTAATQATEVANREREAAREVVVTETGQLEPRIDDALAAEQRGDFAAARAAYEREMRVEDGKFADRDELQTGRDFAVALAEADAITDPPARLDALGAARAHVGRRPELRELRLAALDERSEAAVAAWFEQVEQLEADRPGEALDVIAEIQRHPVARLSPALDQVVGRGDYLEALQVGDLVLEGASPRFAQAAVQFQEALDKVADDPVRRSVAEERLDRTQNAWMAALRSRWQDAADDAAAFEVLQGLEELKRVLRLEREDVLEEFKK
jgi:tetratricopeptide (TPR) repeat protein